MSEVDTFLTIKGDASSLLKEKGSKFIGSAFHVQDEQEAKMNLEKIKKKYHDATHNCWAYRVGHGDKIIGLSGDDGEPSGSAGAPMLSVIEGAELTNLIVIVTRYFGGTKLGVGGLIRAYGGCVKLLIETAKGSGTIIEETIREDLTLLIDYPLLNNVLRVASRFKAEVRQDHEDGKALVTVSVRLSEVDKFRSAVVDASGGNVLFR
ncbi:YigZ family protein [Candidatus Marinimicrobia bacterium MT.SAG.2]|nr:YigZ family protein [Candidatus Marinimicrobia bacterium MT.SAG.2]